MALSYSKIKEKIKKSLESPSNIKTKINDEEILEFVNQIYIDLIFEFKLNICVFTKEINSDDNVFSAPLMVLGFEKAFLNNEKLSIQGFNDRANTLQIAAFSNFQSFAVQPKNKAIGKLEIHLNLSDVLNENSVLHSGDLLKNALCYGSLFLIHSIYAKDSDAPKLKQYEILFEREKNRLRAIINANINERLIMAPCIQY